MIYLIFSDYSDAMKEYKEMEKVGSVFMWYNKHNNMYVIQNERQFFNNSWDFEEDHKLLFYFDEKIQNNA